jgi:hypothetical protein
MIVLMYIYAVCAPSLYVLQNYGTNFHTVCRRHPVYRLLKRISKLIFLNFLLIVPCIFLLIDIDGSVSLFKYMYIIVSTSSYF